MILVNHWMRAERTGLPVPIRGRARDGSAYPGRMPHLEEVLQHLYDCELNVTITMLWDGGFDFALISYMEWNKAGTPLDDLESFVDPKPRITPSPWPHCQTATDLAEAIHKAAIEKFPVYAQTWGRPN